MSTLLRLLLLGAVLFGIVAYVWFDTYFFAIATGFVVVLQALKWKVILYFLLKLLFVRIPTWILTALAKVYFKDDRLLKAYQSWIEHFKQNWREHLELRFIVYVAISAGILAFSLWQLGIWFIIFFEVERVFVAIVRYAFGWMSNTAVHRVCHVAYRRFKATRLGRRTQFIDDRYSQTRLHAENLGKQHRQYIGRALRTWWFTAFPVQVPWQYCIERRWQQPVVRPTRSVPLPRPLRR